MRSFVVLVVSMVVSCAGSAAQKVDEPVASSSGEPARIEVLSGGDFEATLIAVKSAIDARGFKTFAIIDHAAGALSVGMQLPPATEIIFGNPKGGTPLMLADIRLGLELPLRMLIYQGSDGVMIRYVNMPAVVASFGVVGKEALLGKLDKALGAIAGEAAASAEAAEAPATGVN